MGLWHSRMNKFATYEKSLERLEKDLQRALAKRGNRQRRTATLQFWFAVALSLGVVAAAWQVYEVKQLPPGALSYKEHFARVVTAVAPPIVIALLYWVALAAVGFLDGFDRRRVKHLEDTKRAMIKELKNISNFEKMRALIEKYDPDEAAARMQFQPSGYPYGTPTRPLAGPLVPRQAPNPLLRTPGHVAGAAASAVAGAGKALMPLLDTLTNSLVADNPMLLEDLRRVQQQLQEAESQAQAAAQENNALRAENAALRRHLAELGEGQQEEDEQQLLALPAAPEAAGHADMEHATGMEHATAGSGNVAAGAADGGGDGLPGSRHGASDGGTGQDRAAASHPGAPKCDAGSRAGNGGQHAGGGEAKVQDGGAANAREGQFDEDGGEREGAAGADAGTQLGSVRRRMHAAGGRVSMEH